MTNQQMIENYGYILINNPLKQKQFSPKQPTDEFWTTHQSPNGWMTVSAGSEFSPALNYRRPINPGQGFAFVKLDDVLFAGQSYEHTDDGIYWFPHRINESTCGGMGGKTMRQLLEQASMDIAAFRTPVVAAPVEKKWHSLDDCVPKTNEAVWVGNSRTGVKCLTYFNSSLYSNNSAWTHWILADVPPALPQSEKSPEDKAFDKLMEDFVKAHGSTEQFAPGFEKRARFLFDAGMKYATNTIK